MKTTTFILYICWILIMSTDIHAQDNIWQAPVITLNGKIPTPKKGEAKLDDPKLRATIERNVNELFKSFHEAIEKKSNPVFSEKVMDKNCQEEVQKLWENSQISSPDLEVQANLVKIFNPDPKDKFGAVLEVRDIPIIQERATDQVQALNVDFNIRGTICGLSIGLDTKSFRNINDNPNLTEIDAVRMQIIKSFLENFRTAYNRRDIDLLEKIYSEDALIITGRMVTRQTSGDRVELKKDVEYTRQSKSAYIRNLRALFAKKDYINVDFKDVHIYQHPNPDIGSRGVFCVSLDQDWTSGNTKSKQSYQDQGHLFLVINFENQEKPLVQIRVWQPEESLKDHNKIDETNLNFKY